MRASQTHRSGNTRARQQRRLLQRARLQGSELLSLLRRTVIEISELMRGPRFNEATLASRDAMRRLNEAYQMLKELYRQKELSQ